MLKLRINKQIEGLPRGAEMWIVGFFSTPIRGKDERYHVNSDGNRIWFIPKRLLGITPEYSEPIGWVVKRPDGDFMIAFADDVEEVFDQDIVRTPIKVSGNPSKQPMVQLELSLHVYGIHPGSILEVVGFEPIEWDVKDAITVHNSDNCDVTYIPIKLCDLVNKSNTKWHYKSIYASAWFVRRAGGDIVKVFPHEVKNIYIYGNPENHL